MTNDDERDFTEERAVEAQYRDEMREPCGCENSTCKVGHYESTGYRDRFGGFVMEREERCENDGTVGCEFVGQVCRECAEYLPDEYLDPVYVEARARRRQWEKDKATHSFSTVDGENYACFYCDSKTGNGTCPGDGTQYVDDYLADDDSGPENAARFTDAELAESTPSIGEVVSELGSVLERLEDWIYANPEQEAPF